MTSVGKETCERVFRKIEALQREAPDKAVTQKQVITELEKQIGMPKLSKRHIRRTFQKLHRKGKIAKSGRGQYWIPDNLERKTDYLKAKLKFEEEFWKAVDYQRLEEITRLKQELHTLERYYEDFLEQKKREEMLRNK